MNSTAARRHRARSLMPGLALVLALAVLAGCGEESDGAQDDTTAAATAGAGDTGAVTIEDPWVRATAGTEDPSMTAAFLVVDNETDEDVTLQAASSPVAGMVQLHEMAKVDGEMVMQEAPGGILVKAGGGQLLQPGGYHVMLMDLKQELAPGDEVELTLEFSDGTSIDVTAPVKEFTEEGGHYHSPGTAEHSH
jgi:copper(I)-binding protein